NGPGGCVAHCAHTVDIRRARFPERDEAAVVEGFHDDAAAIWTACLESLGGAGWSTHKAWLNQIRPVAVSGDTLVLAVPDEFVKEWIERRYTPTGGAALGGGAGGPRPRHTGPRRSARGHRRRGAAAPGRRAAAGRRPPRADAQVHLRAVRHRLLQPPPPRRPRGPARGATP